ncbi:MAG: hypothetical protein NTV87_08220 [Ignavibacteriae bacterium]|jgi:hypothetical protein|nr:hypothetical protein [Ignavibacteriota bacterium]
MRVSTYIKAGVLLLFSACTINAQDSINITRQDTLKKITKKKIVYTKTEPRSSWGVSVMYGENGFGLTGTIYSSIGRTSDLFFSLSFSGVSDANEVEYVDYYGNVYISNKAYRVFSIPLSFGLKKYVFHDDIEGNLKPFFTIGVAPTLLLSTPFDKNYFKAFGYTQADFAVGPFAGIGMEYIETQSMGLSINLRYYYLPVISDGVSSLKDKPITNVGGVQLSFGFNFQH